MRDIGYTELYWRFVNNDNKRIMYVFWAFHLLWGGLSDDNEQCVFLVFDHALYQVEPLLE